MCCPSIIFIRRTYLIVAHRWDAYNDKKKTVSHVKYIYFVQ